MVLLGLSACAAWRSTEVPIAALWYPAETDTVSASLLVLLPGARDSAGDFERHGVVELAREAMPGWDLVAVNAHMGYYRERSFTERLEQDIILPAQARGYQEIWLSGPSLGGFGSLLYLCNGDIDAVTGALVIAPYLGGGAILADIEAAGGPQQWQPGTAGEDFERELWQCLRDGPPRPVWLAWGEDDRMDRGARMLAELLPAARVRRGPGGHRWSVWVDFWAELLPLIEETDS
jgi:hypothetical protein